MENHDRNYIACVRLPSDVFDKDSYNPNRINLFFGKNGTGKSTFAKLFRNRDSLSFYGVDPNSKIMLFDNSFVTRNIEQYSSMPGIISFSEKNIDIQHKIQSLKQELQNYSVQSIAYQTKLGYIEQSVSDISKALQENCWNKTKDLRKTFEKALGGNKTKQKFLKALFDTTPVYHNMSKLESLYNRAFFSDDNIYPLFKNIKITNCLDSLSGRELMMKPIMSSSDSAFSIFMKKLGSVDWVKNGHSQFSHIAGNVCPYCQQNLPDDFENILSDCFDNDYKADMENLQKYYEDYRNMANSIYIPLQDNLKIGSTIPNGNEYINHMKLLKQLIKNNLELIRKKIDNPSSSVILEFTSSVMDQINDDVFAINQDINENNNVVSNRKKWQEECKRSVLELLAFSLQAELMGYKEKKTELEIIADELTNTIQSCNKSSEMIKQQILELNNSITDTKSAVKKINELLDKAGFKDFFLRQSESIENTYEVVRNNGQTVYMLSEGEQRFLAFLYFYYTVTSDKNDDYIIVIDDAFTGLDNEAGETVKSLIQSILLSCADNSSNIIQLFFLTHDKRYYDEFSDLLSDSKTKISKHILIKISDHTNITKEL